MKAAIRLFLGCVWLGLAACQPERFIGGDISGVPWGRDFVLTAHTGKPFDSRELRGKVVVMFFGFTSCPDICTPTLAKLARTVKQLGSDEEKVQVLFVTVDPQHDNPPRLAQFVPAFHPGFIGLTGSDAQIGAVAKDHQIAYAAGQNMPTHSDVVLVKDEEGKPRVLFRADFKPADLAHDLRLLIVR